MSIVRVKKDIRYFSASNEPFNDKRLSWETRGLMGYLLSKPNNWQIRMDALEKAGPAGNYKLRRMLSEARKYGYMNRIRITLPDKTFDWITEVYESPSLNPRVASGGFSTSGSSTSGKPPDIVITESGITDGEIFAALEKLTGGLNSNTPKFVDTWLEKHKGIRILEAIEEAKAHNARSMKYIDEILIGWEATGYPQKREERVEQRKNGHKKSNPKSTAVTGGQTGAYTPTDLDLELARKINAEKRERRSQLSRV